MVEGARLESVYRGNSIEGSNPSLSAMLKSFVVNNYRLSACVAVHDLPPHEIGIGCPRTIFLYGLELVFINPQALDFRLQCRSRHSELQGCSRRTRNAALAILESGFNEFPFPINEDLRKTRG